jgi:hypothetical protein
MSNYLNFSSLRILHNNALVAQPDLPINSTLGQNEHVVWMQMRLFELHQIGIARGKIIQRPKSQIFRLTMTSENVKSVVRIDQAAHNKGPVGFVAFQVGRCVISVGIVTERRGKHCSNLILTNERPRNLRHDQHIAIYQSIFDQIRGQPSIVVEEVAVL